MGGKGCNIWIDPFVGGIAAFIVIADANNIEPIPSHGEFVQFTTAQVSGVVSVVGG